jgi:hypothetical protein
MKTIHGWALGALLGLAAAGLGACGGTIGGGTGGTSNSKASTGGNTSSSSGTETSSSVSSSSGTVVNPGPVSKIDLVLVVDNSASMADKQQVLALVAPDLVSGLLNPACVDSGGNPVPAAMQPGPTGACPAGTQRDFPVVTDVHVGLLSSSLGTFGADGCPDKSPSGCTGVPNSTPNDDHGHLVTRAEPCGTMGTLPTYQNAGFLAWDPAQQLMPPGIKDVGALGTFGMPGTGTGLVGGIFDLVYGDGQLGCGFESQNESWYRFLVDPTPYQSISLVNNQVQLLGTDQALLQQRKDFLRPDSLLLIVNVSDETDTSIKEFSSYPLFAAPELHLPHARTECTTKGPKDMCCFSCGQTEPAGCLPNSADANCTSGTPPGQYSMVDENTSIRAFGLISHKQRYGIEFFYQPSRYVGALTQTLIPNVANAMVPNPIFAGGRSPTWVYYTAIVGVPWQLIARQANGKPDLINGVSALDPKVTGGFKTFEELSLMDGQGHTYWDDIAGDPENYVPPVSPFMRESTGPRSGTDPITGIMSSPTTTMNGMGNPINDHERQIAAPPDDIEYACIFDLPTPKDCSNNASSCDCNAQNVIAANNPLCAPNPMDSMKPSLQTKAKAYPGIKHLAIAKGLGSQGVVGSICPAQLMDATASTYAYRPAVKALIDRLKPVIRGH